MCAGLDGPGSKQHEKVEKSGLDELTELENRRATAEDAPRQQKHERCHAHDDTFRDGCPRG